MSDGQYSEREKPRRENEDEIKVYLGSPEPIPNTTIYTQGNRNAFIEQLHNRGIAPDSRVVKELLADEALKSHLADAKKGLLSGERDLVTELQQMPPKQRIDAVRKLSENPEENATITLDHGKVKEIVFHPTEPGKKDVDVAIGADGSISINGHSQEQLAKLVHAENMSTVSARMKDSDPTLTDQELKTFAPLHDALLRSDLPGLKKAFESIAYDHEQMENLKHCLRAFNTFNYFNSVTMHCASTTAEGNNPDKQSLIIKNLRESSLVIEAGTTEPWVAKGAPLGQPMKNPELLELQPSAYLNALRQRHLNDVDEAKQLQVRVKEERGKGTLILPRAKD